jgi:hypothetical protein
MFGSSEKSAGTAYTTVVALLALGLFFVPAVVVLSRPLSNLALCLAAACTVACVALAWMHWKLFSSLPTLSIFAGKAGLRRRMNDRRSAVSDRSNS